MMMQVLTYYGPYGGSAVVAEGPYGNTAAVAQGPYGNTVVKGPAGNVAVSSDPNFHKMIIF